MMLRIKNDIQRLFISIKFLWKKFSNKRLYPRMQAGKVRVNVRRKNSLESKKENVENWSPGGLFIRTSHVWPIETLLQLEFCLNDQESSAVHLEAQVVRIQKNQKTHEIEGMGIMFTDLSQSGLSILYELMLHQKE